MKIKSNFLMLDVKAGRVALRKLVEDHKNKVPVTITGTVVGVWGGSDDVSTEFEVDVTSVTTGTPYAHKCHCVRCEARKSKVKHAQG